MHWIYLLAAAVCEIAFVLGMKFTNGFTKLYASIFTLFAMAGGVILLSMAVRRIPLGTAYAIWTGLGIVGTVIAGMLFFGESISLPRMICLFMILGGAIGLKLM